MLKSNRDIQRGHKKLILAFNLLATFWIAYSALPTDGLSILSIAITSLVLLSIWCFFFQITSYVRYAQTRWRNISTQILLFFLFTWFAIAIIRGISLDTGKLLTLLANPSVGGVVWLMPYAVYLGRQPGVFPALMPTFRVHALIGMAILAWAIFDVGYRQSPALNHFGKVGFILLYPAPLILLAGMGKRRDYRFFLMGLGIVLIGHMVMSNRTYFAETIIILVLAITLNRSRSRSKILVKLILLATAFGVLIFFGVSYLLSALSDEWLIDTRTFLWLEMVQDFSSMDWVVGRGALGTYYSPYFAEVSRAGAWGDHWIRQVNEIGYLHIILKTGAIGAILYFSVVVLAIRNLRLLKDKRLGVGIALLLLSHLCELAIIGQPTFQPSGILVWMLVGLALSKSKI